MSGRGGDQEYLRKLLNNTFDGNKLLINCGFLVLQIVKKTDGVHGAGGGRDNISEINFSCWKYFVTDTKIVINEMSVDGMVLAATDVVNSSFLTSPLPPPEQAIVSGNVSRFIDKNILLRPNLFPMIFMLQ